MGEDIDSGAVGRFVLDPSGYEGWPDGVFDSILSGFDGEAEHDWVGDSLKIKAVADELKRGHCAPPLRGEEVLFTWDEMETYYERNHYKLLRRTGYLMLGISMLELMYYLWAGRKKV